MPSPAELDNRFAYHAPTPGQVVKYGALRTAARNLAGLFCDLCPDSRETAAALTHLETALFFANAAIARHPEPPPNPAPPPQPADDPALPL